MAKAVTNYSNWSDADLEKAQTAIATVVEQRQVDKREAVKEQMQEMAKKAGFELVELFDIGGAKGGKAKRKSGVNGARVPVAPKYANPDDADQTWSGRGRQPVWMKEHEQNGVARESMLIP